MAIEDQRANKEEYLLRLETGLSEKIIRQISTAKKEPAWMLKFRLKALEIFMEKPLPTWGADLSGLDFQNMSYFLRSQDLPSRSWNDVPEEIRQTFETLGVPENERQYLAGVGAQYESEAIYHNLQHDWEKKGVLFSDTDTALKEHPDIFQTYFAKVIPAKDNKFAALNSAVWSGGSFVYIPAGVEVKMPLQAYFRINARKSGQFERTLIILEEGAKAHYLEGCSAPKMAFNSLHAGVVEVIVQSQAQFRYTTVQNWSHQVYNLVTKRALAKANSRMEWVDCNLGSGVTMKYPSIILQEEGAKGEITSLALAGKNQVQDAGGKIIHLADHTTAVIKSKSISHANGLSTFRSLVKSRPGLKGCQTNLNCDALLLGDKARSDTFPNFDLHGGCEISHEATVSQLDKDQLFYLANRGLSEKQATSLLVNGFISSITKELPLEYAVELNRLTEMQINREEV
jgi:Fe-S cluster assembly protein SufB